MSAADYLAGLSRLVTLFSTPAATDEERLELVLGLAARARDEALVVHVAREGEPEADGVEHSVDAWVLLEVLRLHRVRRLVIRRGAAARELAQFAGLLVRTREPEVPADPPPAGAPGDAAGAPATVSVAATPALLRGLDALGIWSIQLDFHGPPGGLLASLAPALREAVDAVAAARTPASIVGGYESVARALAASPPTSTPAESAAQVTRALAELVAIQHTNARRQGPDEAAAHREALDRLLEPELETVVRTVVEGTVPEAWRVVRFAAERAVPLLLNRLGDAETIDERRRCFNALLDAGGGVDALLEGLRDPRWYVVRNVALVLGELREPGAVRPLARVLLAADERVREAAAQALARIDTPPATHALLGALRDESVGVRRIAAHALRRAPEHRVPIGVAQITSRLRIEGDLTVALELVEALLGLGTTDAYGALALLSAERDGSPIAAAVGAAALRTLRRVPLARLMPALRTLAHGEDTRLRAAALQVAAQVVPPAG